MKPPHSVALLERELSALAETNEDRIRLRRAIADVIVGQFLDGAVMRGGGALKLRYGLAMTRYTMDFDAARSISEDEFIARFEERLALGWFDFSGRLVKKAKPHPEGIAPQYVMQPFEVKLTYRGHPWCTVDLEVSYNEIGDADAADGVVPPKEVLELFRRLRFPEPGPIPLMRLEYQIAQKIHGATDSDYVRAQDLVDLQLMMRNGNPSLPEMAEICRRLFRNRNKQDWPPRLVLTAEWRLAYSALASSLPVQQDADAAATWLNDLILQIDQAK